MQTHPYLEAHTHPLLLLYNSSGLQRYSISSFSSVMLLMTGKTNKFSYECFLAVF